MLTTAQSNVNFYKKSGLFLAIALAASLLTACGGGGGGTTTVTTDTTTPAPTTPDPAPTVPTTPEPTPTTPVPTPTPPSSRTFTPLNIDGEAYVADGVQTLGCVQDSQTNMFWEVKTNAANDADSDFRDVDYGYRWGAEGSVAGTPDTSSAVAVNTCSGIAKCNPESYVTAVNAMNGGKGLCGKNTWRVPTAAQLIGLLDTSKSEPPYIYSALGNIAWDESDNDGRPFVFAYWSSTSVPNMAGQYYAVSFSNKLANGQTKEHGVTGIDIANYVRLIAD